LCLKCDCGLQVGKIVEGDNLLEKDFSFPCQLLLYPIKLLYLQDTATVVPIEVRVKLLPTWNKLLDAVTMVLILEPGMTVNEFIAMMISKLVTILQEQQAEVGGAQLLIQGVMLYADIPTMCTQ